jgi:hypothetical protein
METTPHVRHTIQFQGLHCKFQADLIWKARAENKCKIHAWVLMHDKILTTDNLQRRGWPHHENCVSCNGPLETGLHLSLLCPFAKALWSQVLSWENFDVQLSQPSAWPLGGRMWQARCQSKNTGHLMECSFTLCGTCGRKGIREFRKRTQNVGTGRLSSQGRYCSEA